LPQELGDAELSAPLTLKPLELQEVTGSIQASFPALQAALQEMGIADGKLLAAWGEFDLKVKAESFSAPEGYYKTFRNLVKLEQALYQGGSVYGHYRIGDGNFQPWYGERETNEGGEFKFGVMTPILRDRLIDQRRSEILKAELAREAVDPAIQTQILQFIQAGSEAYWSWVAAGQALKVQEDLLRLTLERNRVYQARVEAQDLPRIELVQNERLIASREAKLIESQRKLQQAAIKLSLFLRDDTGEMLLPAEQLLPQRFPDPTTVDTLELGAAIQTAYQNRPELVELQRQVQMVSVDLDWGNNQLLPALNVGLEAGKDIGARASSKGDKTPFELEAGLMFDMPLQRRKAKGKITEAQNKLSQLQNKRQFTENKIANETRDAISAWSTAYDRVQKARRNVELSEQLVEAERERFAAQDSDLLRVAIQEAAAIEAALQEIEALSDYYKAEAAYRAATATSLQQDFQQSSN